MTSSCRRVLLGQQLLYNHPQVYDYSIPSTFATENPTLQKAVIDDDHVTQPPWNHRVDLTTLGGQAFRSFAKYNKYGEGKVTELQRLSWW